MPQVPPSAPDRNTEKARFDVDALATARGESARDHGSSLGPLAQQFATLTYSLLDARSTGDVLQQVVDAALLVVPGAELVSVTLRTPDGRFHTPVETDSVAIELDQLQYELREGPCLDVADPAGPDVAIAADLGHAPSWPRFGPAAAGRGLGALLSTALLPDVERPRLSGALNIYSRQPHGLDEIDQAAALLLATHASLALAHTAAVGKAELQAEQLRRAIDSRDVIGQAKGILMARRGVTAADAFAQLRRASQELNIKLVQVAEIVTSRHAELNLGGITGPRDP